MKFSEIHFKNLLSHYSWVFTRNELEMERDGVIVQDDGKTTLFYQRAQGYLAFPDADPREGMYNMTYSDQDDHGVVNHYILGTDYYNYAVTWSCHGLDENLSLETAFVLTRLPVLDEVRDANIIERIETYIDDYLDRDYLVLTDHSKEFCSHLGLK